MKWKHFFFSPHLRNAVFVAPKWRWRWNNRFHFQRNTRRIECGKILARARFWNDDLQVGFLFALEVPASMQWLFQHLLFSNQSKLMEKHSTGSTEFMPKISNFIASFTLISIVSVLSRKWNSMEQKALLRRHETKKNSPKCIFNKDQTVSWRYTESHQILWTKFDARIFAPLFSEFMMNIKWMNFKNILTFLSRQKINPI